MAQDWSLEAEKARSALIVAAMRRTLMTYEELGRAIGVPKTSLLATMGPILDVVSEACHDLGEPSLAALVVNKRTGRPGKGWTNGPIRWTTLVRNIYTHWRPV